MTTSDGSAAKQLKRGKSRGTQDDIELLKLIIEENPGLKKRVLEKIRIARSLSGGSAGADGTSKLAKEGG